MRPLLVGALATVVSTAAVGAQSFFKNQPPRLNVEVTAPTKAVSPGAHATLALAVTPRPGIHVYAPGNPDYIPVAVEMAPRAGVTFQAAVFPPGHDLLFGPLKTAVKVYSEPFDVRVPFAVQRPKGKSTASKAGTVTVHGTLSYQACDDKVCFPPQSAPFEVRVPIIDH